MAGEAAIKMDPKSLNAAGVEFLGSYKLGVGFGRIQMGTEATGNPYQVDAMGIAMQNVHNAANNVTQHNMPMANNQGHQAPKQRHAPIMAMDLKPGGNGLS